MISGSSLGGGSDLALGFGLGPATSAAVRVVWPDGTEQAFDAVPADVRWELTYGGAPDMPARARAGRAGGHRAGGDDQGVRPAGGSFPCWRWSRRSGSPAWQGRPARVCRVAAWLAVAVGIGTLAFQLLHVGEHLLQLGYWTCTLPSRRGSLRGDARRPTASPCSRGTRTPGGRPGSSCCTWRAGSSASRPSRLQRAATGPGRPRDASAARFAFGLELAHVAEHLSLSLTSLFMHVPIGISTLFGGAFLLPGAWATSIRLLFHFAMNLTVTTAAVVALVLWWRARRTTVAVPVEPVDRRVLVQART